MTFKLMELPYSEDALENVVSAETINFHHKKHHDGYVQKLNELIKGTEQASSSLEEIVLSTHNNPQAKVIFNNAAQVLNHNFYWNSMKPGGGGAPDANLKISALLNEKFKDFESFKSEFTSKGIAAFGSSWAWLVLDKNKQLEIVTTSNAENPITSGNKPLITVDLWEHSYYIVYRNKRADYIKATLDNLINWNFAEQNLNKYL